MRNTLIVARRELVAYFASPLAYVFIVVFLALTGALGYYLGDFMGRGQADLVSFFLFQPWLMMILGPALGMRLWAEERRSGTIELLLTLPIAPAEAVLGKFLAAWGFVTVALALTFPMWLTVNYLGEPDNGVILGSYAGTWLMAGALLALSACVSALTRNQVIAFVVGSAVAFLFLMSGLDLVLDAFRGWAPAFVVDLVAALSILTHMADVGRGVIGLPTVVFLVSLTALCLFVNAQIVELEGSA